MTTGQGGDLTKCNSAGCGVIFKLSQTQTGGWKETVLHTFTGSDGQNPVGNLELDQAGNLFGATSSGGAANGGTVFELSPNPAGGWKETLLRSFAASRFSDGWAPAGGVVIDSAGNVYGTTYTGGVKHSCCGTVFELSPGSRNWTETVLHAFSGPNDGSSPAATLAFDQVGNLYGTAQYGGSPSGEGSVYELSPNLGAWTFISLHDFNISDGEGPRSGLLIDSSGNLYGTTQSGGNNVAGTVYIITPQ
jgi:uncharacterized repeat protein (TIGR03803 family)